MPLRTAEQYVNSLRDARTIYFRGRRVADVTAHPVMSVAVRHASIDCLNRTGFARGRVS